MKVFVTNDFCKEARKLVSSHRDAEINSLRTVLIHLVNGWDLPSKYRNHHLRNAEFYELHIAKDVLLLYKYESDSSLVINLQIANITNHKRLNEAAFRKDYEYNEISTIDLHDITSSINIDDVYSTEIDYIYDLLESVSDYASMHTSEYGYVILDDYTYHPNVNITANYDFYSYEKDSIVDRIQFVIKLSNYNINNIKELDQYIDEWSDEVTNAFIS